MFTCRLNVTIFLNDYTICKHWIELAHYKVTGNDTRANSKEALEAV